MSADQLAFMTAEAVGAVGTDLAVMIDRRLRFGIGRARCTILEEIRRSFIIKDARPVGKHGSEISMYMWAAAMGIAADA